MMPPPVRCVRGVCVLECAARTWAKLHEDEDFVCCVGELVPGGINKVHDVGVSPEQSLAGGQAQDQKQSVGTHHDVDLLLDFGEHGIVGDRDALENMVRGAVDGRRGADEVDVRETTLSALA